MEIIRTEDADATAVKSKSECALEIYDLPKKYSKYKVYVKATKTNRIVRYDDIEVTSADKKDNVVANITNKSDKMIDSISLAIVYYDGKEMVGFDDRYVGDLNPGSTEEVKFFHPDDENADEVDYDSFKIFINEAYSFDDEEDIEIED